MIFEAWLLSLPLLPSRQVNMADSCKWIFHLFGGHHCKSRIFERMENFQNDCCRPWTKKPFKTSYSKQLRIVNAVVSWLPTGQIDWRKRVFFSKLKLLILRQWWQLWMKSAEIKQSYSLFLSWFIVFYCEAYKLVYFSSFLFFFQHNSPRLAYAICELYMFF